MANKIEMKKFFGTDVRVVNGDYMVVQDMFRALGRLSKLNQMESSDTDKLRRYAELLGVQSQSIEITTKVKGVGRHTQIIPCININKAPAIVLLFEPKVKSGDKYELWSDFLRFVNDLLVHHNVNMFDLQDKRNQISAQDRLDSDGGKVVIMNNMMGFIMGELCGIDGKVLKGDIRTFQESRPDIRFDLGKVYEEVREDFVNAYSFTNSHQTAKEMVVTKYKKKYPL